MKELVSSYRPKDVLKTDEISLFHRWEPRGTLTPDMKNKLGIHGFEESKLLLEVREDFALRKVMDVSKNKVPEEVFTVLLKTPINTLEVRGIEIPHLDAVTRGTLVQLLTPVLADRTDLEVCVEWFCPDADNMDMPVQSRTKAHSAFNQIKLKTKMDQAAIEKEMVVLDAQGAQLKQSITEAQELEKVASEKAKRSEKNNEELTVQENEDLEKAQNDADKKLEKAKIAFAKASDKLKAAKDAAQLLPLRTHWFEKRNIAFAMMDDDRTNATEATKNLTGLERSYLMTQHRYKELRDQLTIVKGTTQMNCE
ncbi:major facilitator superfamily [Phytophthora cinnamomi]|uniref:major facilitator superfamily n=1 Tax=Phytophthora cinnamomi TaxID=4785 RepID=UPI00355A5297|nr:major facilitator superfamily [Phytophthora cinnamomi]